MVKWLNGNKGSLCIVKKDGGDEGRKKVYGVVGGQFQKIPYNVLSWIR
jgi:hypothetical protein